MGRSSAWRRSALELGIAQRRLARARPTRRPGAPRDGPRRAEGRRTRSYGSSSRGIYPAILDGGGLEAALESLAARAPGAGRGSTCFDDRLPRSVEATAYFVVCEGLANFAGTRRDRGAVVRRARNNGMLVVEIADNGEGGTSPPDGGSGLTGLADRVAALDGRAATSRARRTRRPGTYGRDPLRVVIAEDAVLLREGLRAPARGCRMRSRLRSSVTGPSLVAAVGGESRPRTSQSSTCGCRRGFATRASLAAMGGAASVPATPVLVLSQIVEETYASELLGRAARAGHRLPAEGPRRGMSPTSSRRCGRWRGAAPSSTRRLSPNSWCGAGAGDNQIGALSRARAGGAPR